MGDIQVSLVQHMLAVTFGMLAEWSQRHEKTPQCDRTADETEMIAQREVKVQKRTVVHVINAADHYVLMTREYKKRKNYEESTTCYYQTYRGEIVGVCEKFAGFDEFHYDTCQSVMAESFSKCLFAYETRRIDSFKSAIDQLCGVPFNDLLVGQELGHLAVRMEIPMPSPQPPKEPPPPPPMPPDGMPPTFG